ncbi:MAG: twin-arginine translocation signal domain-containing protein, partial [Anaerolineae bacterium]
MEKQMTGKSITRRDFLRISLAAAAGAALGAYRQTPTRAQDGVTFTGTELLGCPTDSSVTVNV